MKKPRLLIRILLGLDVLLVVMVFAVGAVAVNLRAAEQKAGTTDAQAPASASKPSAPATGSKPDSAGAAPAAGSKPDSAAPAPAAGGHRSASEAQPPESTATIRDDPTIAPDPQESADNNVSFPSDI